MQGLRSPRPLAMLIAAASSLALAAPTAALASSDHHQAPQQKAGKHDNGRHRHKRDIAITTET